MITLYRGDDTSGQLGKNVKIAFHCDDAVNMDGVTVRFNLLNVVTKEWTNVHDGDILEMFVTHEQSGRLPLGFLFGKIWGEDSSGKVRTFANRLPIIVTHDLRKVYGSDGLDSQDIHVYSSVDWDAVANKPTLFPSKVDMVEGLEEALKKANSVKTVNNIGPDNNGNIAIDAESVGAVSGFVKETGVVIPVPEGAGLRIKGKGEYYPFVFLEREDGSSVALIDNEQLEESIDTHNKNTFAHSAKFAKYAPKTTVYTKSEVDDKINQFAAHYLTADANGSAFATVSALTDATAYYYAGVVVSPTKNDYAIVLDDDGKTARWAFFGEGETGVWQRQYYISSVSFTDDQWAAINSGIKDYLVPKVLTVDESTSTKKIALGDKTFTSFAELTALVQNGVTRLKYYVTGAAGRPVLYTAHLCDASAIRFDATGTLGETVYTRSIAITKNGDDGIAVSVGALTQVAKQSDIPSVSAPSASATNGQAADAKATYEALMSKVDAVAIKEEFLPITDVNETYDLSSYTIRKNDERYTAYDAIGNAMCSWHQDGIWMAGDSGIMFNGNYPPSNIPMLTFGATISDITDATKLTPVWSFSSKWNDVDLDGLSVVWEYNDAAGIELWCLYTGPDLISTGSNDPGSTEERFPYGDDQYIDATVVGYKTAKDEELMAGGADAKAALFASEAFEQAVKKAGGFQHDENGYYIEVEEE